MKRLFVLLVIPFLVFACSPRTDNNVDPANANSAADHSQMNDSNAGMKSMPNAASTPYDLQFLDMMIAHHQGAVEMAKMIEGRTKNAEMKKFGAQIIADQEKEIGQMKTWREEWFAGNPSAMNMEIPGMGDSMKMDMPGLSAAGDADFDLAFAQMMILHHEGAITMSREALEKAEHPAIKTLSNQIIKAQQAEIKMMQDWITAWAK